MCGIICVVGKYRYKKIPKALIERGKDDSGIYQDDYVQLIQTRLQITGGKVKLPYEWDDYVLLFNGEVYNWMDFGGSNEYESILMGVKQYGKDLGKYLDGQYYIIAYNKKDLKFYTFQDEFKIHVVYHTKYKDSDIHASNLRSLPKIEFNEIQHRGYGNITKQRVL